MPVVTINLNVEDSVIESAGEDFLKHYLEDEVKAYRMRILGQEIRREIEKSGIDVEKEFKKAKKKSWEKYREEHLKDLLK